MHSNFLLEIGTEELPANVIKNALESLKNNFTKFLSEEGLTFSEIYTTGTPRRLVLYAKEIPVKQEDKITEIQGPPAKVAFNPDGTLTKAGEGFIRAQNVTINDISIKETEKGQYVLAKKFIPGKLTTELLSSHLPNLIKEITFPKYMRWESSNFKFSRPIRWILSLFGSEIVPFNIADIKSGNLTYGHRFSGKNSATVKNIDDYFLKLREMHVIADINERRGLITKALDEVASQVGGTVIQDEELVEENTFLTEFPRVILGDFEEDFLSVPEDILITCMKVHQKFFSIRGKNGRLLPNFVAVINSTADDTSLILSGLKRVLRARLSDARFFYEADCKIKLESLVPSLKGVVFHQKLGSLYDKTLRIGELVSYLADMISPGLKDTCVRASYLCKADLLTQVVGEFPNLQGIMGKIYAELNGESEQVSIAIEEHYMPTHSGGELPSTIQGSLLSIADKIDTIAGIFAIGQSPTGTHDPFGLRRAALGIINIILKNEFRLSLHELIDKALTALKSQGITFDETVHTEIHSFIKKRFEGELISQGYSWDCVEAVLRTDFDDMVTVRKKIDAVSRYKTKEEFNDLSIAFKRVMNILKDYHGGKVNRSLLTEHAEANLYEYFLSIKSNVEDDLKRDDFEAALGKFLLLKPYIDNFFDNVMVMVKEDEIRNNRLALLWEISREFLKVGDISAVAPK